MQNMENQNLEDEREVELSTIAAIFPELSVNTDLPFDATLELQVAPAQGLCVTFKPLKVLSIDSEMGKFSPSTTPTAHHGEVVANLDQMQNEAQDLHKLTYLPSIRLEISLPNGYPEKVPPLFSISTSPAWLPQETLRRLRHEGEALWADYGHTQVIFAYIDYLQQAAERAFDLQDQVLELPHNLRIPLLSFDSLTERENFNRQTFYCGVCLEPKKGSACYQLRHCKHVFCIQCLQDFYTHAITEGDTCSVHCLEPSCGNENGRRIQKPRRVHPTELLNIPLEQSTVQRYVDLKIKKRLESDKSTIYCPRKWCQGPARTKKHTISNDIASFPESDSEEDTPAPVEHAENFNTSTRGTSPGRLAVCSICSYAFCHICQKSWHGDFINCLPRTTELDGEEKASYDYIRLHTSPCPTCSSPVQKTMGCNHMQCFQCSTHFCYLCSSWLDARNPYRHFNEGGSECFQRLWELKEGDEGPEDDRNLAHPRPFGEARAAERAFIDDFVDALNEIALEEHGIHDGGQVPVLAPDNAAAGAAATTEEEEEEEEGEERRRQGMQRFIQMAANDEEDEWDSDELEIELALDQWS